MRDFWKLYPGKSETRDYDSYFKSIFHQSLFEMVLLILGLVYFDNKFTLLNILRHINWLGSMGEKEIILQQIYSLGVFLWVDDLEEAWEALRSG